MGHNQHVTDSSIANFDHADCEHYEPIDGSILCLGNCGQLADHLRQTCNTPVQRVVVGGDEQAAEVWLNEYTVKKGCPYFSATQDALDLIAEQLQSPCERFGLNQAGE